MINYDSISGPRVPYFQASVSKIPYVLDEEPEAFYTSIHCMYCLSFLKAKRKKQMAWDVWGD